MVVVLNPVFLALTGILIFKIYKKKIKGTSFKTDYFKILIVYLSLFGSLELLHVIFDSFNITTTKGIIILKSIIFGFLGVVVFVIAILTLNLKLSNALKTIPTNVIKRLRR